MRHKRPGPLVRGWHRLRHPAARALAAAADYRPGPAVISVVATLVVGFVGYLAMGAGNGEPPSRAIDPAGPVATTQTDGTDGTDGPTPFVRTSPSDAPPTSTRSTPGPTGSATPVPPSLPASSGPGSSAPSQQTDPPGTRSPRTPPPTPSGTPPGDQFDQVRDTTPPSTRLTLEQPTPDSARLTFGADERATYLCSFDGAASRPCPTPRLYTGLKAGWHTFEVSAVDTAGNVDPSPAVTKWQVKRAPTNRS
jgi:hypothetical protein